MRRCVCVGARRVIASRHSQVHRDALQARRPGRASHQRAPQAGSARRSQERTAQTVQGQWSGRQLQARREGREESQETESREEAEGRQVAQESQEAQEGGGVGRSQAQGCLESQVARQSQGRQAQDGQEARQGCCQVAQEAEDDESWQDKEGSRQEVNCNTN